MAALAKTPGTVAAPAYLDKYQGLVHEALHARLAPTPPPLGVMLRYHMGWESPEGAPQQAATGKRLRPILCLFTCEAVGGDARDALPAAVALEYIHNFSLIHDDIQDRDAERHGRATVWAVWGAAEGMVAGNALRAIADASVHALAQGGANADAVRKVSLALTASNLALVEGQRMDLNFEQRLDVTPDEYLAMVSRKTGALVAAAMGVGATLGRAHARQASALTECGRLLGLSFQARDDVLGIWGDPAVMGKPTGADIRRRKKSLPIVYAFSHAAGESRRRMETLYATDTAMDDDDVGEVMGMLDTVGAHAYAQALAEEQVERALELAREAGIVGGHFAVLEQLAQFFAQRDH